jgi:Uma2 family endonuclease
MSIVTVIQVDEDFTADALDELPDDGNRYELVDGLLLVSPSPPERHQPALVELLLLLKAAAPSGLRVYAAPLDVRFSPRVQTQPDLLVVEDGPPRDRLDRLPLLCVELLSPGTRRHDLLIKRRAYEREGVDSYWLVDPAVPSLMVLELRDGAYVEGDEAWTAVRPYAVTLVPSALLR